MRRFKTNEFGFKNNELVLNIPFYLKVKQIKKMFYIRIKYGFLLNSFHFQNEYRDNQKTMEQEGDIIAII